MNDDALDPHMPPELRALREARRQRELTPAERRREAELVTDRLRVVLGALELAASPITAEVDQIDAAVRDLITRIETMADRRGLSIDEASPDATRQLACTLLRAAESVIEGTTWSWGTPELERVRRQLGEVELTLTRAEELHAEQLAEWEKELGREDGPTGQG